MDQNDIVKLRTTVENLNQLALGEDIEVATDGNDERNSRVYDLYFARTFVSADPEVTVQRDENACILAVTSGWSVLSSQFALDHGWQYLRSIDEAFLGQKDHITRIAMLYLFRRLSLYLEAPAHQKDLAPYKLPLWLLPRPSQEALDHPYVVDYVLWPCMRERLCFGSKEYRTDEFWLLYHQNCWFHWPHSASEACGINSMTGLQSLNPRFLDSILDLDSWTMGLAFLGKFPEFEPDILTAGSILKSSKKAQSGIVDIAQSRPSRSRTRPRPLRNISGKKSLTSHQWNSYLGSLAKMKELTRSGGEKDELNGFVTISDSKAG